MRWRATVANFAKIVPPNRNRPSGFQRKHHLNESALARRTYWSSTVGCHIVYESRLELTRLLFADFEVSVRRIVAPTLFRCTTTMFGIMNPLGTGQAHSCEAFLGYHLVY